MTSRRFLRRRRYDDRGAVLIEVAMVLPMLLIIALAVFDLGLAWRASMTVTSGARAGARVASNLGVDLTADREALMSTRAAISQIEASKITKVVIYKSTGANGDPPATCLTSTALSTGGNSAGNCNVYKGTELDSLTSLNFASCTGRHKYWCPTSRQNQQAAMNGPDYIGVYVEIQHPTVTKFFGSTFTLKEKAVMMVEPNAGDGL